MFSSCRVPRPVTAAVASSWLTLRLEVFGAVVILGVGVSAAAAEAWVTGGADAALVGLSLSYALKVDLVASDASHVRLVFQSVQLPHRRRLPTI